MTDNERNIGIVAQETVEALRGKKATAPVAGDAGESAKSTKSGLGQLDASPILTPELIEKAAKALIATIYRHRSQVGMEYTWVVDGEKYKAEARAALEAVLPDLLRHVAEKYNCPFCADDLRNALARIAELEGK